MDALNHPNTGAPYSVYGVPNIDVSGWVADLGLAVVWMTIHEETKKPDSRAPKQLASPDFDAYYKMSAPEEDILGDADAYAMKEGADAGGGTQKVSQVLRDLYLGGAGKKAGVSHRWRSFCKANGLAYSDGGGKVTFDQASVDRWVTRIDRFSDLYGAGGWGTFGATLASPVHTPGSRQWPYTRRTLQRFLDYVALELGAELIEP